MAFLAAFDSYLHDVRERTPLLIKAEVAHAHFETVHPFLGGSGRVGRLPITLQLRSEGALSAPELYLSLYFKTRRDSLYTLLQRIRSHGEWDGW